MSEKEKLKDLVLQKEKEGKIVLMTSDGLMEADIDEFIKQPAEGLLYDLNRDRATVLTFIDDPKWVNDYAVGIVIAKLKEKIANQPFDSDGKEPPHQDCFYFGGCGCGNHNLGVKPR